MEGMNLGDQLAFEGPIGRITYLGQGKFMTNSQVTTYTHVNLIAAGSGITPIC